MTFKLERENLVLFRAGDFYPFWATYGPEGASRPELPAGLSLSCRVLIKFKFKVGGVHFWQHFLSWSLYIIIIDLNVCDRHPTWAANTRYVLCHLKRYASPIQDQMFHHDES